MVKKKIAAAEIFFKYWVEYNATCLLIVEIQIQSFLFGMGLNLFQPGVPLLITKELQINILYGYQH